jgi:uncharacterized membrane protein
MDDDEGRRADYERAHDPTRVLALSDGVFAIILTLLVLEIHVPDLTRGQTLRDALREVYPSFVAFFISFVVVAIAWAGHRDLFARIRRTDSSLVWLNVLYLFPLSLLPFGASLLSRYDRDPVAIRMYGSILVAIAVVRVAMWLYATKRSRLLYHPIDQRVRKAGILIIAVPGTIYAIALAIASAAPGVSVIIYAAAPVVYFAGVIFIRGQAPPGSEESEFME